MITDDQQQKTGVTMANSDQKTWALNEAINIAKDVGKGGAEIASNHMDILIYKMYTKIVEILDEIESSRY